jgi:hypothetical protein
MAYSGCALLSFTLVFGDSVYGAQVGLELTILLPQPPEC